MEIEYEYPITQKATVDFDEADLAEMSDILKKSFIDRMWVIGLSNAYYPHEDKLVQICKKYGVDSTSKLAVTNFFSAVLGVERE